MMKKDNIIVVTEEQSLQVSTALERRKIEILKATENQNTKRTYQNALNCFSSFVIDQNTDIDIFSETIDQKLITDFITHLQPTHAYKTIETYVYALNTIQAEKGLIKPVTEIVKKFLMRVKKFKNQTPQQAKAIDFDTLAFITRQIDTNTNKGKRDKALLLVGFFGCLRRSELSTLQTNDTTDASGFISFDGDDGFYITLKKHKTDKTGEPITKYIQRNRNAHVCPYVALKKWLETLGTDTAKYVFVKISKMGKPDKYGNFKDGNIHQSKPLTTKSVNEVIKNYLGDSYSGHSLRVGFAVSAKDKGATIDAIQTHGGWQSATMPTHYTKQADTKKHSATKVF